MRLTTHPAPRHVDTDTMSAMDKEWRESPDRPDMALKKIWVVYVWNEKKKQWMLAGFRRRRQKRKPQTFNRLFAKLRRALTIPKQLELKVLDLASAQTLARSTDRRWLTTPPQRHAVTTRPAGPLAAALERPAMVGVKQGKRRIRNTAVRFHKKETQFIALGRKRFTERKPGFLYLGPLTADSFRIADREAQRMFGVIWDVTVLPVSVLSKRLRQRIHKGRKVLPGQTRLMWPEPVDLKDLLKMSITDARLANKADLIHLSAQLSAKMDKAARKDQDDKVISLMAMIMFVETLL